MEAIKALSALAQETRLTLFRLLVRRGPLGLSAGEISDALGVAPNALSFHLRNLVEAGLIGAAQEGRFVRYTANIAAMRVLMDFLSAECCEGNPAQCGVAAPHFSGAGNQEMNVLILCTGNSARSILGEALLNAMGEGRFRAYSAGSHPAGKVSPLALEVLQMQGVSTDGLESKSWDRFVTPDAPKIDLVITVCDKAGAEICPIWPGVPLSTHWGLPDPAAVEGTHEARLAAFVSTAQALRKRFSLLMRLPEATLANPLALQQQLDAIGRIDEVTA